jgi:hypothetical protein
VQIFPLACRSLMTAMVAALLVGPRRKTHQWPSQGKGGASAQRDVSHRRESWERATHSLEPAHVLR